MKRYPSGPNTAFHDFKRVHKHAAIENREFRTNNLYGYARFARGFRLVSESYSLPFCARNALQTIEGQRRERVVNICSNVAKPNGVSSGLDIELVSTKQRAMVCVCVCVVW